MSPNLFMDLNKYLENYFGFRSEEVKVKHIENKNKSGRVHCLTMLFRLVKKLWNLYFFSICFYLDARIFFVEEVLRAIKCNFYCKRIWFYNIGSHACVIQEIETKWNKYKATKKKKTITQKIKKNTSKLWVQKVKRKLITGCQLH